MLQRAEHHLPHPQKFALKKLSNVPMDLTWVARARIVSFLIAPNHRQFPYPHQVQLAGSVLVQVTQIVALVTNVSQSADLLWRAIAIRRQDTSVSPKGIFKYAQFAWQ